VSSLNDQIAAGHSRVYRRAYIKRRNGSDGQFETDWQEITKDVKRWGTYKAQLDANSPNRFSFGNATLVMVNNEGKYNPEDDEISFWYNYLSQQRTLVRIEAGFLHQTLAASGVWINSEYPGATEWDVDFWDYDASLWDAQENALFTGIIAGDINLSNKNEVQFNIKPLMQIFQDYSARNLTGWSAGGMTASQFMGVVRDHTDGSGAFVFRPFFGDTTTYWDISTTSIVYTNLNTSTAKDVIDASVWDVMQKLAEVENFVPYVTRDGTFKFVSRNSGASTTAYEFYGGGVFDNTYGLQIKEITNYGKKLTKFYSRVQVKYNEANTSSSYEAYQSSLVVSGGNNPWNLGERSLNIENLFIPSSAIAQSIALTLFTEYSALKNEIEFTSSFIPHLEILDRVTISYDSPATNPYNLWDQGNWADDATSTSTDLIFDVATGDAIRLADTPFRFLSIDVNLDKMETKFLAREV
jgi:hypothetical protein